MARSSKADSKRRVSAWSLSATSSCRAQIWALVLYQRSVGPAPAIVRALPPIPDLSTFFHVTSIVLDLTNASMLTNHQFQNFQKYPTNAHPGQPLAMEIEIRDPPIRIEGNFDDGGTWVHQYMKVMEKGANNDYVRQRSLEVEMEMKPWNKICHYRRPCCIPTPRIFL